jgi:hypothetical protein
MKLSSTSRKEKRRSSEENCKIWQRGKREEDVGITVAGSINSYSTNVDNNYESLVFKLIGRTVVNKNS